MQGNKMPGIDNLTNVNELPWVNNKLRIIKLERVFDN